MMVRRTGCRLLRTLGGVVPPAGVLRVCEAFCGPAAPDRIPMGGAGAVPEVDPGWDRGAGLGLDCDGANAGGGGEEGT